MKKDTWKRIGALMLLLAAVLLLTGAGSAVSTPYASTLRVVSAQSNEFTAVSIPGWAEALPGATGAYGATSSLNDAHGNSFVAVKNEDPGNNNTTWVEIARYSPQPNSVETGRWFVNPGTVTVNGVTEPTKIDGVGTFYSGNNVIVDMSVHALGNVRIRDVQRWIIEGIFVNAPGFSQTAGGPNAYQPIPQAPAECVPINYGTIQNMITTAKNDTVRQLEGDMPQIISNTLAIKKVLTEANTKDYLYQFVLDREYEVFSHNAPGYWDWLNRQIAMSPTPTATPHP